jgi:DNA-binding NarL/FixJ family response regulator
VTTYIVTIKRTTITEVMVSAGSPQEARQYIESYGPDLAASDMANQDVSSWATIKSVRVDRG